MWVVGSVAPGECNRLTSIPLLETGGEGICPLADWLQAACEADAAFEPPLTLGSTQSKAS